MNAAVAEYKVNVHAEPIDGLSMEIEFPLEVGILCWVSTIIFWVVIVVAVWKIVKAILNKYPLK